MSRKERILSVLVLHRSAPTLLPEVIRQAQAVVERAVEGGYFDEFEGQSDTHEVNLQRLEALTLELLAGQFGTLEVYVAWDPVEFRTRILVAPPIGTGPPPVIPNDSVG